MNQPLSKKHVIHHGMKGSGRSLLGETLNSYAMYEAQQVAMVRTEKVPYT